MHLFISSMRFSGFRFLLGSQILGIAADQVFLMSLLAVTSERSDLALSFGSALGARFLGLSLLIPVSGVLADRYKNFRLLISSDILRFCVALFLIVFFSSSPPLLVLLIISFVLGAGESLFEPAYDSYVPQLVSHDALPNANYITNLTRSVGQFGMPALAAFLVGIIGVRHSLLLLVVFFFLSSLFIFCSKYYVLYPKVPTDPSESFISQVLDGIQIVKSVPWLYSLQVMALLHTLFAVGPWMVALPFIFSDASVFWRYGVLLSTFALGGAVGSFIASIFYSKIRKRGLFAILAISLFSLACFSLVALESFPLMLVCFFVAGLGTQYFDVVKTTAIQDQLPSNYLGRVFSIDFFSSFAALPIGQVFGGFLIHQKFDVSWLLFCAGIFVVLSSLSLSFVPGVMQFKSSFRSSNAS